MNIVKINHYICIDNRNNYSGMEETTIAQIITALKRLIKELKSGYCNRLSSEQIERLENGFSQILEVEKEVKNGLCVNRNNDRRSPWSSFVHHVFPIKKERDKGFLS